MMLTNQSPAATNHPLTEPTHVAPMAPELGAHRLSLDFEHGTLITYNPRVVTPDVSLAAAWELMVRDNFHHLPVVDAQRRMIGMLSDLDVLVALERLVTLATEYASDSAGSIDECCVGQVMTRQVLTIDQEEGPLSALHAMVEHHFHSIPVVHDGSLVGMITSTDFMREFSYGDWPGYHEPVAAHITPCELVLDYDAALDRAAWILTKHDVAHAVVTRNSQPCGVLSRRQLRHLTVQKLLNQAVRMPATQPLIVGQLLPVITPVVAADYHLGRIVCEMLEHRARAVPVVDADGVAIGVISEDEILAVIARMLR